MSKEVEGKQMQVLNCVILIPKNDWNFANGQNSVLRPFTESMLNDCNLVKGQHFVNSVEIVHIPMQEGTNSAKK